MSRDQTPQLPERFQVIYPTRRCGTTAYTPAPSDPVPSFYVSSVDLTSITPTDSAVVANLTGVTQTKRTVRSTATALYATAAGPPTNQTELDDLAMQLAQDFVDWTSADRPGDLRFGGIIAPEPNGLIDTISWLYASDDVSTRVQSPPYRLDIDEYQHFDPATADCNSPTKTDWTPAIPLQIPGGQVGQATWGLLTLEDGRLVFTFKAPTVYDCGCTAPPPCQYICIAVTDGCPTSMGGRFFPGTTAEFVLSVITAINLTSGGSGYTTAPIVTIAGPNTPIGGIFPIGTRATATAALVPAGVASVSILNQGAGYDGVITVTFIAIGPGSGATGTATIVGGQVTGIVITAPGSGYVTAPAIAVTGSLGGGGFSGIVRLVASAVGTLTLMNPGNGYLTAPAVTIASADGNGSGATATTTLTQTDEGSCDPTGMVDTIKLTASGTGYTGPVTVSFSGGSPTTAATATATIGGGGIRTLVLNNGGIGYTSAPTVVFSGGTQFGGGLHPTAIAKWSSSVLSITVTNGGSGYTQPPTVDVEGNGTVDAEAVLGVGGAADQVVSVHIFNHGHGYTTTPAVNFLGGNGAGATGTAVMTPAAVSGLAIISPGSLYTAAPTVSFTGGGGSGATATATINPIGAANLTLISGGEGYSSTPTISLSDPTGTGAAAIVTNMATLCCIGTSDNGTYLITVTKAGYYAVANNGVQGENISDPAIVITSTCMGGRGRVAMYPDHVTIWIQLLNPCKSGGQGPFPSDVPVTIAVTAGTGGSVLATGTLDSSGQIQLSIAMPQPYPLYISVTGPPWYPRYLPYNKYAGHGLFPCPQTPTKPYGQNPNDFGGQLSYDQVNYVCACNDTDYPIPRTLHFTTNAAITGTVVYSGNGTWCGLASLPTSILAGGCVTIGGVSYCVPAGGNVVASVQLICPVLSGVGNWLCIVTVCVYQCVKNGAYGPQWQWLVYNTRSDYCTNQSVFQCVSPPGACTTYRPGEGGYSGSALPTSLTHPPLDISFGITSVTTGKVIPAGINPATGLPVAASDPFPSLISSVHFYE